ADRDHVEGRGGGAGALDVDVPGEGRGELSALGRVHRVVGLLPVPHPHDVQVTGGQAGLEVHHRGGEVLGAPGDQALAAGKTGETGEALQVPGVGRADLGVVLLAVVGLVRQAQPALVDLHLVARGVLVVGPDVGQKCG